MPSTCCVGNYKSSLTPRFDPSRPQNKVYLGDIWNHVTFTSSQPLIWPLPQQWCLYCDLSGDGHILTHFDPLFWPFPPPKQGKLMTLSYFLLRLMLHLFHCNFGKIHGFFPNIQKFISSQKHLEWSFLLGWLKFYPRSIEGQKKFFATYLGKKPS